MVTIQSQSRTFCEMSTLQSTSLKPIDPTSKSESDSKVWASSGMNLNINLVLTITRAKLSLLMMQFLQFPLLLQVPKCFPCDLFTIRQTHTVILRSLFYITIISEHICYIHLMYFELIICCTSKSPSLTHYLVCDTMF